MPKPDIQDAIAAKVVAALRERDKVIYAANVAWSSTLAEITASLCKEESKGEDVWTQETEDKLDAFTIEEVKATLGVTH